MEWSDLPQVVVGGVITAMSLGILAAFRSHVLITSFEHIASWFPKRRSDSEGKPEALLARQGLATQLTFIFVQIALFVLLWLALFGIIRCPSVVFLAVQMVALFTFFWLEGAWMRANLGRIQRWVSEYADLDYTYESYKILYFVSSKEDDSWIRKMKIRAEESIVGIKTIQIGIVGSSLAHMRGLRLSAKTDAGRGSVLLFPFVRGKRWMISTLLTEPVAKGAVRNLIVSGRAPGTWTPLRQKGHDLGSFHLHRSADLLEFVIILPNGEYEAELIPGEVPSGVAKPDAHVETDLHGRVQLVWSLNGATPGTYTYKVRASRPGV